MNRSFAVLSIALAAVGCGRGVTEPVAATHAELVRQVVASIDKSYAAAQGAVQ
jgi:hypothetical protein